jgi:hypothetical protein
MSDFETAVHEIFKAADAFCETSKSEQAERLDGAIRKNMRILEGNDKLHQTSAGTTHQLIDACLQWIEAASEDRGLSDDFNSNAHTAARDIRSLALELGQLMKAIAE